MASTLLPNYTRTNYRGRYRTEEEYLAALRAWAHEKEFMTPVNGKGQVTTLTGFYGTKTSQDYIEEANARRRSSGAGDRSGTGISWRRKKSTAGALEDASVREEGAEGQTQEQTNGANASAASTGASGRRRSSLAQWFQGRRRSSVAVTGAGT